MAQRLGQTTGTYTLAEASGRKNGTLFSLLPCLPLFSLLPLLHVFLS
jgi:hypothetical protein